MKRSFRWAPWICCAAVLLQIADAAAQQGAPPEPARQALNPFQTFLDTIRERVHQTEQALDCRIGLAWKDKAYALQTEYRARELFHAASTMKLPVMIEVFRQADQGLFTLDDKVTVNPECKSFLEDTTFVCDAGPYLSTKLNAQETIHKLTEQMIVVSDNLATNLLIERCGYRKINSAMRTLGAESSYVLRGVQDITAFRAGLSNRMTAHDLNVLNEAIDRDLAATPEACEAMRELLLAQQHGSMIPAQLPRHVKVAHKTGAISATRHDTGIVYAPFGTWYLTILADHLKDEAAGEAAIAELSRAIYEARRELADNLPKIDHSFKIEFTPSRIHLTKRYAEEHYSKYYEKAFGSPEMPGLEFDPKVIVVHYTAGTTLQGAFNTFAPETLRGRAFLNRAGAVNVGVQFIVDRDGSIYQIMPDNYFGRHCIGLNHCAIGFENVGRGDIPEAALRGEPQDDHRLTLAQLKANVKLIRYLKHKYPGIEILIGHSEYRQLEDPQHAGFKFFHENDPDYRTVKSDPGKRFMEALRAELQDMLQPSTRGQVFRNVTP